MKYVSGRICVVNIYIYLVGFGAGKWPSQQEVVCPCGAVSGQQVVVGEGVYKCGTVGNYCCGVARPRRTGLAPGLWIHWSLAVVELL